MAVKSGRNPYVVALAGVKAFLVHAAPGSEFEYFRGNLGVERGCYAISEKGKIVFTEVPEIKALADAAQRASEQGEAELFRRRKGPSDFSYIMRRRKRV